MNETQIRNEPIERRDDVNADPRKWAEAIQNLHRIIERSEQKLEYFAKPRETGKIHGSSKSAEGSCLRVLKSVHTQHS